MGNYNELCHYEMKDRAISEYRKQRPYFDSFDVSYQIMSDFDENGYVAVFLSDVYVNRQEAIYSFAFLNSLQADKGVSNGI